MVAISILQQGFEAQVYLEVKGCHKFGTFLVANSILQQGFEAQVYLEVKECHKFGTFLVAISILQQGFEAQVSIFRGQGMPQIWYIFGGNLNPSTGF